MFCYLGWQYYHSVCHVLLILQQLLAYSKSLEYLICNTLVWFYSKLRHYRACREEEAHLMSEKPNWQVGTFYGKDKYADDADIFRGMYTDVTRPFEEVSFAQSLLARGKRLMNQVL